MNRWRYIYFFDKNGKYYNFDYDSIADMWTGAIFLPEVSVGLFEVGQLNILQQFIQKSTGLKKFGYPHSYDASVATGNTGNTGTGSTGGCNWVVEWETDDPDEIFLFQFNQNFTSLTQSSLDIETIGPPLIKSDQLIVPLDYDPAQTIEDDYIVTDIITSNLVQLNFTINSSEENTFKRTLIVRDECTSTIVGKFVVYAETIGEDDRLKVMTENLGYNITMDDSLIFKDTNIYEHKPNFIEINRKRKELMMEGHNIYPYIGSYKGLINAIKFFGYNNLQIREFWKNVNTTSPNYGKYIQTVPINMFNTDVNYNDLSITIPNKNFKKTNMFSLVYKINRIIDGEYDTNELPLTTEVFDFTIEEVLIKLFGLKKKLENEFLPLNAHIKDIIGEGDFFGSTTITNTISRNDKRNIVAGIPTDFKVSPNGCSYLQDLRSFAEFCFREEAVVAEAVVDFCNAYIAPLITSTGNESITRNIVLGPYTPGDPLPPIPFGPDLNGVLGDAVGGQHFTISDLADVYIAYLTKYAPNLDNSINEHGYSSRIFPDKPNIPVGALVVLENNSFGKITWNSLNMTFDQIYNANRFHAFDLNPQGINVGDTFNITDPITNTGASYTVSTGDTISVVVDSLYNQLVALKNLVVTPWVHWDISKITLPVSGESIRVFGNDTQRILVGVSSPSGTGSVFNKLENPGELLFTWDSIERGNYSEIEWTIYKEETDISPEYFYNVRGAINQYETLPITLPYVGTYSVEMRLYDLFNNISSIIKDDAICVEAKEVEYSGWYQSRKYEYSWNMDGSWKWGDYGSTWDLPIEPAVTWDTETPSLYDSLDRVNAILNTFGLGVSPNFTLLNFQDNGSVSFSGPYYWNNLDTGGWNDSYHLWWDMTSTTGDTPAFFQFKEIVPDSYLRIVNKNGQAGAFYFDPVITTLAEAASALNVSDDPIINKYIYNLVYDATNQEKFIQGVARYFGVYGDWAEIDIVDINNDRICAATGSTGSTGNTGSTGDTGCESLIYKKGLHRSSNPTWNTAKFINDGVTLPKFTWVMFVYDKCKINGKNKAKWTIRNVNGQQSSTVEFSSKYLTYLFKDSGKYEIGLELTDSNGNKYKKSRNMLIIK